MMAEEVLKAPCIHSAGRECVSGRGAATCGREPGKAVQRLKEKTDRLTAAPDYCAGSFWSDPQAPRKPRVIIASCLAATSLCRSSSDNDGSGNGSGLDAWAAH